MYAIINKKSTFGTIGGVFKKNDLIMSEVNKMLKNGKAKLIVDSEETLMYRLADDTSASLGLIKVCPDPQCDAVWHNIPKKHTRCNDCGGRVIQINEKTYWKKFSNNFFQYDFESGDYFRPQKEGKQIDLDLY